ncbi:MAG: MBL fold metallo-hydrolase [Cyanophyceae cyanobacterium]
MPTSALFTALPVGVGDAFLWQSDEHTVLVDGGLHKCRAAHELRTRSITSLDVVVCTHADADHTDGLVAILQDPLIAKSSVWVPARWGEGLKDLVEDPEKVLYHLSQECKDSASRFLGYDDES